MVQWLGFLAFTEAVGVRFPVSEFACVKIESVDIPALAAIVAPIALALGVISFLSLTAIIVIDSIILVILSTLVVF
ncbi:hypothetical protein BB561_004992 [Smittium simulii]|uniref:Uncharacterized protein n=1 Tax=Smittium simulii TaxID=133385 RepID=A0A2T9YD00_9FUNG|nr:hypothetical protein BB561_004992 [Smittium simulii]